MPFDGLTEYDLRRVDINAGFSISLKGDNLYKSEVIFFIYPICGVDTVSDKN